MTDKSSKLTPSNLAALMCARICHDLVSPIGALGAALEVLNDESNADMHEDAMDLVRTSAGQATNKLKFLRLAFGAGTSAPGMLGIPQLEALIQDMYGSGKATIRVETDLQEIEKTRGRLVLNLVMVALQSIPRGGELVIELTQKADANIFNLTATGPKARIYEEFQRSLAGRAPEDGFDGRTIQPFYAGMLVRELGGRIDSSLKDDVASFTVFLPENQAKNAA